MGSSDFKIVTYKFFLWGNVYLEYMYKTEFGIK